MQGIGKIDSKIEGRLTADCGQQGEFSRAMAVAIGHPLALATRRRVGAQILGGQPPDPESEARREVQPVLIADHELEAPPAEVGRKRWTGNFKADMLDRYIASMPRAAEPQETKPPALAGEAAQSAVPSAESASSRPAILSMSTR